MCTLTFAPTIDGYMAGMNRDELLTRPRALPPQVFDREGMEILHPREITGETWIACNSQGNLLALLNWNDPDATIQGEKRKSRGTVIPELIGETDSATTNSRYKLLSLDGVFPFRLVGVFWNERILNEWRWDGVHRLKLEFHWVRKHWFSSSLSDACAEVERGRVCETAVAMPTSRSKEWLGSLHRSHVPAPGPFSICVHRQDAATVSYTEVRCSGSLVSMDYLQGNPCLKEGFDNLTSIVLRQPKSPQPTA
jgi:hypothetical protein